MTNPIDGNDNKNVNHNQQVNNVDSSDVSTNGRQYSKVTSGDGSVSTENLHKWIKDQKISKHSELLQQAEIPGWLLEVVYTVSNDINGMDKDKIYSHVGTSIFKAAQSHGVSGDEMRQYNILTDLIVRGGNPKGISASKSQNNPNEEEAIGTVRSMFNKAMSAVQRGIRIFLFFALIALIAFGTMHFYFLPLIIAAALLTTFIITMLYRGFKNKHSVIQQEAIVRVKKEFMLNLVPSESDVEGAGERLEEDVLASMMYMWKCLTRCCSRKEARSIGVFRVDIPTTESPHTYISMYGTHSTAGRLADFFGRSFGFKGQDR